VEQVGNRVLIQCHTLIQCMTTCKHTIH
jgi:hypothetical protein